MIRGFPRTFWTGSWSPKGPKNAAGWPPRGSLPLSDEADDDRVGGDCSGGPVVLPQRGIAIFRVWVWVCGWGGRGLRLFANLPAPARLPPAARRPAPAARRRAAPAHLQNWSQNRLKNSSPVEIWSTTGPKIDSKIRRQWRSGPELVPKLTQKYVASGDLVQNWSQN